MYYQTFSIMKVVEMGPTTVGFFAVTSPTSARVEYDGNFDEGLSTLPP